MVDIEAGEEDEEECERRGDSGGIIVPQSGRLAIRGFSGAVEGYKFGSFDCRTVHIGHLQIWKRQRNFNEILVALTVVVGWMILFLVQSIESK